MFFFFLTYGSCSYLLFHHQNEWFSPNLEATESNFASLILRHNHKSSEEPNHWLTFRKHWGGCGPGPQMRHHRDIFPQLVNWLPSPGGMGVGIWGRGGGGWSISSRGRADLEFNSRVMVRSMMRVVMSRWQWLLARYRCVIRIARWCNIGVVSVLIFETPQRWCDGSDGVSIVTEGAGVSASLVSARLVLLFFASQALKST